MARVIHYYAHPAHKFSGANRAMWEAALRVGGISNVDLYADYPRYDIRIDAEQERLLEHDVIVLQFPLFWYSAPALVKEWIDLTFERGFAYGDGGDKLDGKWLMLAITTAGAEAAYSPQGYQHYPLRTFLTPFEQTARLSGMRFAAPYVMYDALRVDAAEHVAGFARLLGALRDDTYDLALAETEAIVTHETLPIRQEAWT